MSNKSVTAYITAQCPYCSEINQINPPGEVCVHYRGYRAQLMEAQFVEFEQHRVRNNPMRAPANVPV